MLRKFKYSNVFVSNNKSVSSASLFSLNQLHSKCFTSFSPSSSSSIISSEKDHDVKQNNETPSNNNNNNNNDKTEIQLDKKSTFAENSQITLAPPPQKIKARRWLEQNPIEKWTCLFDAAATINTLLDDDLWEPTAAAAAKARARKKKKHGKAENPNDRSCGAPMTDGGRRERLREEIRLALATRGIRREHLAATFTGMGFWTRSVTDTQETIARHHQPWAFCKRHWQTLVAHPFPRKLCEYLVDHRTSGRVLMGDVSAEQMRPQDIKSGVVVIDATCGSGFAVEIGSGNDDVDVDDGGGEKSNEEKNRERCCDDAKMPCASSFTFQDLTNFRRLLEMTFAHVMTALFIENHACRLFVEDRLVYLIMCLIFQHLLERNSCLDISLSHEVTLTRQQQELEEVRKILDPKLELSSWVLIGTDKKFRNVAAVASDNNNKEGDIWDFVVTKQQEGDNKNTSQQQQQLLSPALIKLCQYAIIQKPNVIYYDESASQVVEKMEKMLFPTTKNDENEENVVNATRNKIIFTPIPDVAKNWIDHVKTPYVSFFGPRSWECSLEFRKQILTKDINPTMGIEFTSRGKKSLRAYQKKLEANIRREEEKKRIQEENKKKQEMEEQKMVDPKTNQKIDSPEGKETKKLPETVFTGGRRRKVTGLSENQNRQHHRKIHNQNNNSAKSSSKNQVLNDNNNSDNNNKTTDEGNDHQTQKRQEENEQDGEHDEEFFDLDAEEDEELKNYNPHGLILASVGINVDAKMMTRAYPQLRTPCGSGNSFRYKSVARCVLRRGTPIGGVFNSGLVNTLNSMALIFGKSERSSEKHAAPWSVTGKCVIDEDLKFLFEADKQLRGRKIKTATAKESETVNEDADVDNDDDDLDWLNFDKIHSKKLSSFQNVPLSTTENKQKVEGEVKNDGETKSKVKSASSSLLLLQERSLEYLTGRCVPYEAVPVIFGKINF